MPESEFRPETPLGLGMALAEDPRAMAYYAGLNPEEREVVIDQARCIKCGTCLEKCKFGAISIR